MVKVIAIINGKGGVGKTTATKLLIWEALAKGLRVLAIDLDPKQLSLTTGLGLTPFELGVFDGMHNIVKIFQSSSSPIPIKSTIHDNLWVLPGAKELEGISNACSNGRDLRLKHFLKSIEDDFDVIFIDTNPGITSLQNNAILCADTLVMPSQPEADAGDGMKILLEYMDSLLGNYESEKSKDFFIIPSLVSVISAAHLFVLKDYAHIPEYFKSLKHLRNRNIKVLEPIYKNENFVKVGLFDGVYFVQDSIRLVDSKQKKLYREKDPKSVLLCLENIGNAILNN